MQLRRSRWQLLAICLASDRAGDWTNEEDWNLAAQRREPILRARWLGAEKQGKDDSAGQRMPPCINAELLLAGLLGKPKRLRLEGAAPDLYFDVRAGLQVAHPLRVPAPSRRDKDASGQWVRPENLEHDRSGESCSPAAHCEEDEPFAKEPAQAKVVEDKGQSQEPAEGRSPWIVAW